MRVAISHNVVMIMKIIKDKLYLMQLSERVIGVRLEWG